MERTIQTRFYEFNQNNSGGYFDVDENVCHCVIIEAMDKKHAVALFEPMIENQSGSCSCCGDRWSPEYAGEIKLEEYKEKGWEVGVYSPDKESKWFKLYGKYPRLSEPEWTTKTFKRFIGRICFNTLEEYLQFLANEYGWTTPDIRIHYLDGTKKEIFKESKEL